MTDAARDTLYNVLERWGFPTLVAIAVGFVLRNDVLLPLVEEHRAFVKSLSETQREISQAMSDQTQLLHELRQARSQQ